MDEQPQKPEPTRKARNGMAQGLLIGIAIGIAMGLALDSIAIGMGVGLGIGAALGAAFSQESPSAQDEMLRANRRPLIIAALAVLFGIFVLIALLLLLFLR
jgi:hypothetical protein